MKTIARDRTLTDYSLRLNRALLFIEHNAERPMSLEEVAKEACFSPFHFHRLFTALMLRHGGDSVTGIALKSGYGSPASFTKAFTRMFGVSPRGFRKRPLPLSKSISPDGDVGALPGAAPSPEFRRIEAMDVLFVRRRCLYAKAAGASWASLMRYAHSRGLLDSETRAMGITHDDPRITTEENIRYDACIPAGEVGVQTITGSAYAVFLHRGGYERLSAACDSIFAGWLPGSGRVLRVTPSGAPKRGRRNARASRRRRSGSPHR
jgi:AraC family transcriptional regulator